MTRKKVDDAGGKPTEVGFHNAVMTFFQLSQKIANREQLDSIEAELNKIAEHLQPGNVTSFAGAVRLVSELSGGSAPAPTAAITEPLKVPPVKWSTHKDKKNHATHYTATWEGFKLRVERKRDPQGKVIFEGFVNDALVLRGKSRVRVRSETESEALRRLTAKPR